MTRNHLRFLECRGKELEPWIDTLGDLRIRVFREFPYLYDGDPEYERAYLEAYRRSPDARTFLCLDGELLVGATTCLPLADADPAFQAPFQGPGPSPEEVFYLGESVLLPEYRGRGVGRRFFDLREQAALECPGCRWAAFCAVDRAADDPRRPSEYRDLSDFWRKRGYTRREELVCEFPWREVGDDVETPHRLTFWMKPLE